MNIRVVWRQNVSMRRYMNSKTLLRVGIGQEWVSRKICAINKLRKL